jgi:hypothetical protein
MKREPQPRSFHLKLPVASGTGLGHGRTKQKIGKAKFNVHGRNTRISLGARQQKKVVIVQGPFPTNHKKMLCQMYWKGDKLIWKHMMSERAY